MGREQHDGDNRKCHQGQDNDGGQCEAKCNKFLHMSTPFFFSLAYRK
jgi:hypothetical protein